MQDFWLQVPRTQGLDTWNLNFSLKIHRPKPMTKRQYSCLGKSQSRTSWKLARPHIADAANFDDHGTSVL